MAEQEPQLTLAGGTVWLTGLPSAGKTTIAHALALVVSSGSECALTSSTATTFARV